MAEYISSTPGSDSSLEDLNVSADILYEMVESAFLKNQKIPNQVELAKCARSNLEIGLLEAMRCVKVMEDRYRKSLQDMKYFS